jgi:hypothetical protein
MTCTPLFLMKWGNEREGGRAKCHLRCIYGGGDDRGGKTFIDIPFLGLIDFDTGERLKDCKKMFEHQHLLTL